MINGEKETAERMIVFGDTDKIELNPLKVWCARPNSGCPAVISLYDIH